MTSEVDPRTVRIDKRGIFTVLLTNSLIFLPKLDNF